MARAGVKFLPVDAHGLNELDRVFVAAYCRHFDGAKAIEEAFPGVVSVPSTAAKHMLSRPEIMAAINDIAAERRKRYAIDAERVLREFATIGFADIRDVVTWKKGKVTIRDADDLSPEQAAAISEITETVDASGKRTVKVKMHPKVPALEALGKNLRLFQADTNVNLLVANLTALPEDVLEQRVMQLMGRKPARAEMAKLIEATPVPEAAPAAESTDLDSLLA